MRVSGRRSGGFALHFSPRAERNHSFPRQRAGGLSGPVRFRAAEVLELSQGIERLVPRAFHTGNVLAESINQPLHIEFAAGYYVRRFDGAVLRSELVLAGGGAHEEGLIEGGGEIAFEANEFGLGDRHLFDKGGFGGSGWQPFAVRSRQIRSKSA